MAIFFSKGFCLATMPSIPYSLFDCIIKKEQTRFYQIKTLTSKESSKRKIVFIHAVTEHFSHIAAILMTQFNERTIKVGISICI